MTVFEEIKTSLEQAIAGEGEVLLSPEQQRNKELVERYPYLLPRNVFTDKLADDYNYDYINGIGEIPPGWNKTDGHYEKTISFEDEWNRYIESMEAENERS